MGMLCFVSALSDVSCTRPCLLHPISCNTHLHLHWSAWHVAHLFATHFSINQCPPILLQLALGCWVLIPFVILIVVAALWLDWDIGHMDRQAMGLLSSCLLQLTHKQLTLIGLAQDSMDLVSYNVHYDCAVRWYFLSLWAVHTCQ